MRTLTAIIVTIFLLGCAGQKAADNGLKTIKNAKAMVINTGSPLVDGCGYLLEIDSVRYHADNFADDSTLINKKVKITATITGETFRCGLTRDPNAGIPIIHITKVER
ncbi:hypothetical protein [Mucilaginibacter myungsuensis]|uniref:Lipoprotein n=1 Tax=Mucilaginibacter myungsuensis TaxID=649104 RepID=A0A929L2R6_9SPHI|nr:hypothetical protein [Mucilaginibacter myungsuensis]MBE9662161.1 hypothetical protein [Mucilaginibacter myungsuensis]MDN3599405.1 hypothetical protein [Mucilaginibacter myungsuensis]